MTDLVLENAMIVDVGAEKILPAQNIEITGSLITGVHARESPLDGGRVVDCSGRYVMSGLTDMHVHIETLSEAQLFAVNVIPGRVSFTLDIRAPTDAHRKLAVANIVRRIGVIAKRRDLSLQIDVTHENRTVPCASWLKAQVAEAVTAEGYPVFELPSGAGHDGMAMIEIADVAMLFVRCRGGISHNPAEHVETADADAGARVLLRLIENFRPKD